MAQTININTLGYTDVAFDANNFSGVGGTFTATGSGFVSTYKVLGKTLFWELNVIGDTSATPNNILCVLPNGYTIKNSLKLPVFVFDGTDDLMQHIILVAGAGSVEITRLDTNPFANATGVNISFSITIQIE